MNREYLEKIRKSSAYPTLRGFATFFAFIGYLLAALVAAVAIVGGFGAKTVLGLLSWAVASVVIILLTRLGKEAALLLADVADAVLDIGSRGLLDAHGNQHASVGSGETRTQKPTEVRVGESNLKCSDCGHLNEGFAYKCAKCQKALLAAN
jgi:hypothetical protein